MDSEKSQTVLADVVVGARGWVHQHWMENFYPEDIPEEWRLGYYANEFNTLLVPWTQWSESVEELEEGLEDTADDFHLYLELPSQQQEIPEHLARIQERVTGFVCRESDSGKWQAALAGYKVCVLSSLPEDNDVFQRFVISPGDKNHGLVLINGARIADLSMMREQLEMALQNTVKRLDIIFIDEKPDMEAMQNTRMIAELMGA